MCVINIYHIPCRLWKVLMINMEFCQMKPLCRSFNGVGNYWNNNMYFLLFEGFISNEEKVGCYGQFILLCIWWKRCMCIFDFWINEWLMENIISLTIFSSKKIISKQFDLLSFLHICSSIIYEIDMN